MVKALIPKNDLEESVQFLLQIPDSPRAFHSLAHQSHMVFAQNIFALHLNSPFGHFFPVTSCVSSRAISSEMGCSIEPWDCGCQQPIGKWTELLSRAFSVGVWSSTLQWLPYISAPSAVGCQPGGGGGLLQNTVGEVMRHSKYYCSLKQRKSHFSLFTHLYPLRSNIIYQFDQCSWSGHIPSVSWWVLKVSNLLSFPVGTTPKLCKAFVKGNYIQMPVFGKDLKRSGFQSLSLQR